MRARYYSALLLAAALGYLVPGLFYWHSTHSDYSKCLWGAPDCALTVATFLLDFITGCAFIAAFQAARYAFKTFQIGQKTLDVAQQTFSLEQSAIIGVQVCKASGHISVIDLMLHSTGEYELRSPRADETAMYYAMSYEFASFGRAPAVAVCANAEMSFFGRLSGNEKYPKRIVKVDLHNIRADGEAHVVIWIAPELLDFLSVEWLPEGATHKLDDKETRLEFYPIKKLRPEFRGIVSYERVTDETEPDLAIKSVQPAVPRQTELTSLLPIATVAADSLSQPKKKVGFLSRLKKFASWYWR